MDSRLTWNDEGLRNLNTVAGATHKQAVRYSPLDKVTMTKIIINNL